MKREDVVNKVAIGSTLLAILSLLIGMVIKLWYPHLTKKVGYPVIGAWVLLPPVWFFLEWAVLCSHIRDKDERDRIKHLHDLSRNIWLALVVVLAALFGINWK